MGYFSWSPLGTASGTNTGDVTLAAVGAVPNANSASLSGQVLTLQPANGSFPGVVTTSAQTFAGVKTFSSAPILKGIIDASAAAAGNVGEIISASQTSLTNTAATTVWFDALSISLTAGCWRVLGSIDYNLNAATMTGQLDVGISSTTGNSSTGLVLSENRMTTTALPTTGFDVCLAVYDVEVNISATTTYYTKGRCSFSAGQPAFRAFMKATRVR